MSPPTRSTLHLKGRPPRLAERPALPPTASRPRPPEVPLEKFFFVWAVNERAPHRRHATLMSARAEIARLRALAPAKEFLVYEARHVEEDGSASPNSEGKP